MNAQAEKGPAEFKYWAFLSYSHTDKKWGDWLHKALETYRVPQRLVGKKSRDGKIPERLFPIFRDREELPVSADLSSNINEALRESRYLIVICSPRSAQSRWVGEEIKTFKTLGREDRILAFIVDGEPNASDGKPGFKIEDECFHEAMRYRIVDGEPTEIRTEPIAADAREIGDGKPNAKLKLLAGLLGVNYDDLKQREQERRLRRARMVGAGALSLTIIFAGLAGWALVAERRGAAQKRQTQHLLVVSDSAHAQELFERNDAAGALPFLARAVETDPEDRSVPAERLWFALTERSWPLPLSNPMRHRDAILSAYISPDHTKVLTASRDTTARLWDANSGKQLTTLEHPRLVRRAIFTADGRYVVTICLDGVARLWDASSGKPVPKWHVENPDAINSVALSSGDDYLATGSKNGTIRVWNMADATRLAEIHERENVHTLMFHPSDKTLLLSVSAKIATLWKLPAGARVFQCDHGDQINAAEFNLKGDRILTASSDRSCRLWDSLTGQMTGELSHDGEVTNAMFSFDGELVATVVGRQLLIWKLLPEPKLRYMMEHELPIASVRFSHDNAVAFVGTNDGKVQAWNLLDGKKAGEPIREEGAIATLDLDSTDKRLLVATANGAARVWLPPPRYPVADSFVLDSGVEAIALSPDRKILLTACDDGTARLWDVTSGKLATTKPLAHKSAVLCAAFSPDREYVVTGSADATARVWVTSSGDPVGDELTHETTVNKLAFSPNGSLFGTATEGGVAQLWEVSSQHQIGKPITHDGRITAIEFSSDGKLLLTAGWDMKVQLSEVPSGRPIDSSLRAKAEITCAHFSSDGKLVAAGSRDGVVNLWRISSSNTLVRKLEHQAAITDLSFSADNRRLAVASEDGSVAIWDVETGRPVCDSIRHKFAASAVTFSHDSLRIATASEDSTARIWDASSGAPITEPLPHRKPIRCLQFTRDDRMLLTGSADHTVQAWDVAANLTVSDRHALAGFARTLSPFTLAGSGRLQMHAPEPGDTMAANAKLFSGAAGAFAHWFFATPAQRPLTPYATTTLASYVAKRLSEKSDFSRNQVTYFSRELPAHSD